MQEFIVKKFIPFCHFIMLLGFLIIFVTGIIGIVIGASSVFAKGIL